MEEQGARLSHADRNPDTESPANTPSERSNSQDERVGTQHEGTFRRWVISVVIPKVIHIIRLAALVPSVVFGTPSLIALDLEAHGVGHGERAAHISAATDLALRTQVLILIHIIGWIVTVVLILVYKHVP